jgi:hypothetical protein
MQLNLIAEKKFKVTLSASKISAHQKPAAAKYNRLNATNLWLQSTFGATFSKIDSSMHLCLFSWKDQSHECGILNLFLATSK